MVMRIEPYKGIAAIYESIRPSYPEKLIDDVVIKTSIDLEDNLLEIGAGTGKATIQFADKGFSICAVELGEDMAEILKDKCTKYPKVSVAVAPFEQWECPPEKKYDMIYCAQAFHWLDANIKYKKCHELLKDGGFLALFWYSPCDDESPVTKEIEDKIDKMVCSFASSASSKMDTPERRTHDGVSAEDERKSEIESSKFFELVEKLEYTNETLNDAYQYLKVKKSIPAFTSILDRLDDETIEKMDMEIINLISSYGGYVSSKFNFSLYIAKKVS